MIMVEEYQLLLDSLLLLAQQAVLKLRNAELKLTTQLPAIPR